VAAARPPVAPAAVHSQPRDASRIGLPVAALAAARPDGGLDNALLVAAALLLAAAACGSLALGVAARDLTRPA